MTLTTEIDFSKIRTVNGVRPDDEGNIELVMEDVLGHAPELARRILGDEVKEYGRHYPKKLNGIVSLEDFLTEVEEYGYCAQAKIGDYWHVDNSVVVRILDYKHDIGVNNYYQSNLINKANSKVSHISMYDGFKNYAVIGVELSSSYYESGYNVYGNNGLIWTRAESSSVLGNFWQSCLGYVIQKKKLNTKAADKVKLVREFFKGSLLVQTDVWNVNKFRTNSEIVSAGLATSNHENRFEMSTIYTDLRLPYFTEIAGPMARSASTTNLAYLDDVIAACNWQTPFYAKQLAYFKLNKNNFDYLTMNAIRTDSAYIVSPYSKNTSTSIVRMYLRTVNPTDTNPFPDSTPNVTLIGYVGYIRGWNDSRNVDYFKEA